MQVFRVPMNRWVVLAFVILVALIAGTVAWSFRSGLTWTAICLIAVAGPLSLLYWYMLLVNPARAEILANDDGLMLSAPPFLDLALPWSDVVGAALVNLKSDPLYALKGVKRGMKFGSYRSGIFPLPQGGEAFVLGNSDNAVYVDAGEVKLLLAPSNPGELLQLIEERRPR
ncbi:MAG: hypothetical protein V3573_01355 [Desulfovibrionaceae bacterium]